jgi:hypothetical protein
VEALVTAYLDLVDAEAPGLVTGLYLTGSLALDDFRPARSDVDFVAVTAAPVEAAVLAALGRVHGALAARMPRPLFEGIYLTPADLARAPACAGPLAYAYGPQVREANSFERTPVTWAILARRGVAVRGPAPAELGIYDDPARLDQWTRQNLVEYWRPWHARADRLLTRAGLAALQPWAAEWGALGVSRLHYTLATGQIASKYGAGLYALQRFSPRWHPPIVEALRIRRGDAARSVSPWPIARRRDLLRYVAMVIDDALALPPRKRRGEEAPSPSQWGGGWGRGSLGG